MKAKKILEHVQAQVNRESLLFRFSGLHLAACYGRMGQHREQLDACRQVLQANPQSLEAKLGSAAALEALGRTEEAIEILPKIPLDSGSPAAAGEIVVQPGITTRRR